MFLNQLHRHRPKHEILSIQLLQNYLDEHPRVLDELRICQDGALMLLDGVYHTPSDLKLKHTTILELLLKKNIDDERRLF